MASRSSYSPVNSERSSSSSELAPELVDGADELALDRVVALLDHQLVEHLGVRQPGVEALERRRCRRRPG